MHQRPPILSIALLSLAALAYEILLMRLFSIVQWHHFAYMVISLALLGYGASGTFVSLLRERLISRFPVVYTAAIGLFGVFAIAGFLVAQALPFNAGEVLWDPRQPGWLLLMYLLLAIPFFFAATAIALALSRYPDAIGRLYAFDLFGAGLGGLVVISLLFLYLPFEVLATVGGVAMLAMLAAALELRTVSAWLATAIVAMPMAVVILLALHGEPAFSPYKDLTQSLRIPGTAIVAERSSPLGLLHVMESREVPLRHAPGLSLRADGEPPPQVGVFTDGGNMTVITRDTGDPEAFAWLDQVTPALPYHLHKPDHALILGAGGGADVLQARYHETPRITAVELNPQLVELVREDYAEFSGHLYAQDNIEVHIDEARGFVSRSNQQYDLIQVALMDAFGASTAGLYALNESYLYTVEAFVTWLEHITPGGYLSISRWIKLPPRDTLKLLATATAALRAAGIEDPETRLVLIRSWQTSTLLVKNGVFAAAEINSLKAFCEQRAFDVAWYPGMRADEANRFNRLHEPWFYQAALALAGGGREGFLREYKFDLRPSTDDRPYFFHFFKWSVLPEILGLRGSGGMSLLEQGYLVSVAALLQAIVASVVLILLPLGVLGHRLANTRQAIKRGKVLIYFFVVGLAFLFIEIAFIQKFVLILHHPLYAAATVMTGFLLFAGLGSLWSQRLARSNRHRPGVMAAVSGIAILSIAWLLLLSVLPEAVLSLPFWLKLLLSLGMIAPLAFLMGMPFPLALSSVGLHAPALLPWAWGVNGCASVISAILATLLAIHGGFSLVIGLAASLYIIAALNFPGPNVMS